GGLRHAMPWTFWTMTIATFAIAGVPPLAGFFSKDEILWRAYSSPFGGWGFWLVGLITALLTAFYMFRLWFLTFFGEFRGARPDAEHAGREAHHGDAHGAHHSFAHESPKVMTVPLLVLAVLSLAGGWIGIPEVMRGGNHFEHFLAPALESHATAESAPAASPHEPSGSAELALTL